MAASTAAVLVGSVSPAIDLILPRNSYFTSYDRARHLRCLFASTSSTLPFLSITSPQHRRTRRSARYLLRSGEAGSNFDVSDEDDGNRGGEEEDWEVEMRRRLRELEEMKELEKRAEELQTRLSDEEREEGEDDEEKRTRVRRELEKLAKEQAERRQTATLMYELGQKMYGKGMYGRAIEFLEGALTIIPRTTLFGGEIQIWLAMAYEANNRHKDCIELYQQLEKQHPIVSIRRQASELRYILQAPKLKITKEEMVTIPLIGSSYDRYAGTWTDKNKNSDWYTKTSKNQPSSSRDPWGGYVGWSLPAGWEKNKMLWLAVTLWLGIVGIVLLFQT